MLYHIASTTVGRLNKTVMLCTSSPKAPVVKGVDSRNGPQLRFICLARVAILGVQLHLI